MASLSDTGFALFPWRFCFRARGSLHFPPGKSGNILRGAFGSIFRQLSCPPECPGVSKCPRQAQCPYARIFEPAASGAGPSGLADWPRPFVFRAAHLDGQTIAPGEQFYFDLNVFDLRDHALSHFVGAFARLAEDGLGPGRGRADLTEVWQLRPEKQKLYDGSGIRKELSPFLLPLRSGPSTKRLMVDFVTPTELKSAQAIAKRPEFGILFARARDRVAALRTLYGAGPLDIDFRAMGDRAFEVEMVSCDLRTVEAERRSTRTGQAHSIGGFTGRVEYAGEVGEFIPYLEAACWTGVGRQTVWGKGQIRLLRPTADSRS